MKYEKILAMMITLAILTTLVLSGPANAFLVSLSEFSVANPTQGDKISTAASITINSNERININNATLFIDNSAACSFAVNEQETNCAGVSIKLIGTALSSGYGYGYGYGYRDGYGSGTFTYNITLDTANLSIGDHDLQLKLNADNNPAKSEVVSITIKPQGASETETNINVQSGVDTPFLGGDINIRLNGTGRVVVSSFPSQPNNNSTFGLPALGKWFQIEPDLTDISGTIIKVYYTDAEVSAAGLNENSLRLHYYNSTSGLWEKYDGVNGGVDIVNNYVWAKTNHFSTWGVFGTYQNSGNGNSGSSGTYADNIRKLPDEKLTIPPKPAENKSEHITLNNADNNPPAGRAGITGAVVGVLGDSGGLFVLLFILGIVGMAIAVNIIKKRKIKREAKQDIYLGSNVEMLGK